MDEKERDAVTVQYFIYEGEQVRNERIIKRLIAALVLCIILMFASNALWLYEWCQYDYGVTKSVDMNTDEGDANYVGDDNGDVVINGKD